jgi:FKBP-type peptidyl-prolyl cis-trans isomerase FkpA
MRRAILCLVLAVLTGCSLDAVRSRPLGAQSKAKGNPVVGAPETLTYAPSLNVDIDMMAHTESGLYWKDLTVGTGAEAVRGSVAVVDYSGWLANGNLFDSSKNAGRPYSFTVGQGRVIAGWDEGVAGMRAGGRRLLVIPPQLGYGSRGSGAMIPGNATLVCEVELLEVRGGN